MTTTLNWRAIGWAGAAALLAVPAIAMALTREVRWTAADFLVFGAMLLAAGGGIELATRTRMGARGRVVAVAAVVAGFVLVWIELAVGIFG